MDRSNDPGPSDHAASRFEWLSKSLGPGTHYLWTGVALALALMSVGAAWHLSSGTTADGLHPAMASAVTAALLLICLVFNTRRLNASAAKAALLSEEIRQHTLTSQQHAQQELRESERQIRLIVDCATDYAIFQRDLDGRLVNWNKGTERIFEYSAEELRGLDVKRLFPCDDAGNHIEQSPATPTGYSRYETEGWRLRKNGSRFWGSGVVQPIRDGAGDIVGMAVVLRDTTEQRGNIETQRLANDRAETAARLAGELRAEIEAANLELVAANQGLQQFTSIVAHDLRAPLKRIEAFIGALREDYTDRLDDEGREIMTRVSRGAMRMQLMLDSLLDYSRYNAKAIGGKTADLSNVIKDVMQAFDFQNLTPDITVNAVGAPRVKGDPLLLAHVFQNLISNSIKFHRDDKVSIDIDVKEADAGVRVTITDNGIGIEPQFADQVFDMFARLHDEDEYEGTGIGLTVCRKIVNDHGGKIWVDKDYTGGTRIHMTLSPVSENQCEPDLAMLLYQSMQRRRRDAGPALEAVAAVATVAASHHARFDRRSQ